MGQQQVAQRQHQVRLIGDWRDQGAARIEVVPQRTAERPLDVDRLSLLRRQLEMPRQLRQHTAILRFQHVANHLLNQQGVVDRKRRPEPCRALRGHCVTTRTSMRATERTLRGPVRVSRAETRAIRPSRSAKGWPSRSNTTSAPAPTSVLNSSDHENTTW